MERKLFQIIMKKILSKLFVLLSLVLLFSVFTGSDLRLYAAEPELNAESKTLYTGQYYVLKLKNADGNVSWSSSDSKTAVVEEGKVTGKKAGKATITATCNKKEYTCEITVKTTGLTSSSITVKVDATQKITVKGTMIDSCNSCNKKIATVDNKGVVTGVAPGNTTIFVKCANGKTYGCNIRVYNNINFIENPTFEDLAPTVNMSFEELVGNTGVYGFPEGFPVPETYRITVDLYWHVVMVYRQDENGKYTLPVRYMICSSGADSSRTPTGTFKMKSYRVRNSIFNNTTSYAQYWSLITGRIYFHSILYTSLNASDYTVSSWNALGKNVSHGCIRLTVPDARWIWYNCAPGTVVEIRSGSSKDTETAAIREKLKLAKAPDTRVKLKEGQIPWTDNWTIEDVPHDVGFVNGSQ